VPGPRLSVRANDSGQLVAAHGVLRQSVGQRIHRSDMSVWFRTWQHAYLDDERPAGAGGLRLMAESGYCRHAVTAGEWVGPRPAVTCPGIPLAELDAARKIGRSY
jgi:hypothetical protein